MGEKHRQESTTSSPYQGQRSAVKLFLDHSLTREIGELFLDHSLTREIGDFIIDI